ncbi:hypothetical protein FIBSPDRAFT_481170 [Athelia psychrophila]|uniref:Uncharacterized protein n=1 Tax=Athelia psychrophila TaxID=1759441 RepID=A0A166VFM7_9AGAM|nr:hypothetical protein FIBSPDRAFT_481170 [Fibularhizoctonia sp. CBS 109695]
MYTAHSVPISIQNLRFTTAPLIFNSNTAPLGADHSISMWREPTHISHSLPRTPHLHFRSPRLIVHSHATVTGACTLALVIILALAGILTGRSQLEWNPVVSCLKATNGPGDSRSDLMRPSAWFSGSILSPVRLCMSSIHGAYINEDYFLTISAHLASLTPDAGFR